VTSARKGLLGVALLLLGISPVLALAQPYAVDTLAIVWLDGLQLRGIVPVEVARWVFAPWTLAGIAIGSLWGVRFLVERVRVASRSQIASVVSKKQVVVTAVLVAASIAIYMLSPQVREWVQTAIGVLARGEVEVVRDYLRGFGIWAPLVSATLMILQSIAAPLPAFVVTFANGLLFGWVLGALLSWSSAMAGAALCFWIARAFGRPPVEKLAGGSGALEVSDLFFERYGDRAVLIARLLPFVSFDIISYGAGLTSMSFRRFFIATGLGQLPATIVYSYLGQNLTGSARVLFMIFLFTAVVFVAASMARPLYLARLEAKRSEREAKRAARPESDTSAVESTC
jgi:uncharacterized membrane protein YdjX (TVP38/TMEM64 family)